jgi:hypothetical protein
MPQHQHFAGAFIQEKAELCWMVIDVRVLSKYNHPDLMV